MLKIKRKDFNSFVGRAKHMYNIRSEDNRMITYVPNESQKIIERIRQEEFARSSKFGGSKKFKSIILKGRQVGGTTDTAMAIGDILLQLPLARALVLAHDDISTQIIYSKYKDWFNNLPDSVEIVNDDGTSIIDDFGNRLIIAIKPETESYSGYQLKFKNMTQSSMLVRTAGSGDNVGKGDTLNAFHLCLHKDAEIILSSGESVTIENIKAGDTVITSSGDIAKVSNKWYSGVKDTITVQTWLADSINMTKEHKVLTQRGYIKAGELTKNDWIRQPKLSLSNEITEYHYKLPFTNNRKWFTSSGIKEDTIKLNYDFGYYLGYYLAEGHVKPQHKNKDRFSSVVFGYHVDENFIDIANKFASKYTEPKHKIRKGTKTKTTSYYCQFLAHLTNDICGRVEDKNIPEWFFKTNPEFIKGVIVGYLAGDGSKQNTTYKKTKVNKPLQYSIEQIYQAVQEMKNGKEISDVAKEFGLTYQGAWRWNNLYKDLTLSELYARRTGKDKIVSNYISAVSIHEKISRQLKRLILALDVCVPSVKKTTLRFRYGKATKDIYIVALSGDAAKFFTEDIENIETQENTSKHINKYKKIDDCWYIRVKSIKDFEKADVYDIEVNHPDHNFETSIGIVSNSEFANYAHAKDVLNSISQSMPSKTPYQYGVIESTANGISGIGEEFYSLWNKSVESWERFQKGITTSFEGYRPIFIPWYQLSKYRKELINHKLIDIDLINFHSPEKKKKFLDMEEYILESVFKNNREEGKKAINWYRWCIKENCGYDINEAMRYYPTVPEDAFLSTDNSFFDTGKLFQVKQDYSNSGEPEFERGYVDDEYEFQIDPLGDLKVFERPDSNYMNRYVVSVDPATGIEGGDYSCMMVYDRLDDRFVAKWYGNLKEDLLAEELLKLAYYYNEALIVPEMNLRTVTNLIVPDGLMPYTGDIYQRFVKSRNTEDYGYNTLGSTKGELLNKYVAWLRDDYTKLPDIETINEHISFIKKASRGIPKYEAAEGKHDDIVISCLEGNTWIKTKFGAKKIKDIEIGDEVLTHRGNYKKVTNKAKRKSERINIVKSTGRPELLITDEHPILCFRSKIKSPENTLYYDEPCWNSIDLSLKVKSYGLGYIASQDNIYPKQIDLLKYAPDSYSDENGVLVSRFKHNNSVNNKAAKINRFIKVDKDFCRLMGYFYAEGCSYGHLLTFSSHDKESNIRQWLTDYINDLGIKVSEYSISENGTVVQVSNQVLSNFFKTFENKSTKKFPYWVENLPNELKKEVLVGAFIGDGNFSGGSGTYATISFSGGFQIYNLLVSLNLRPSFFYAKGQNGNKPQFNITLGRPDTKILLSWFNDLKEDKIIGDTSFNKDQTKLRYCDKYLIGKVNKIESKTFNDYVYNISVEDDESYVANGIVVHNCALAIEGANWWDEEIAELNENKNDIKKIINRKPAFYNKFKTSNLGMESNNLRDSQFTTKKVSSLGL